MTNAQRAPERVPLVVQIPALRHCGGHSFGIPGGQARRNGGQKPELTLAIAMPIGLMSPVLLPVMLATGATFPCA
jgi:hypothetical protein